MGFFVCLFSWGFAGGFWGGGMLFFRVFWLVWCGVFLCLSGGQDLLTGFEDLT